MTVPTPEPDPAQVRHPDVGDDLVEVDTDSELPDDGTERHGSEVDPAAEI